MKRKGLSKLIAAMLVAGLLTGCGDKVEVGESGTGSADVEKESEEVSQDQDSDGDQEDGNETPDLSGLTFGPYDWPVDPSLDYSQPYNKRYDGTEFTRIVNTGTAELPEGMEIDDNTFTWQFEATTGLKPKTLWSAGGDAFSQKQNQAIASGEIPDLMCVSMTQYYMLIKSGLIADLTEELREGEHPTIQKLYALAGNKALDILEVDGRIYGIPQVNTQLDGSPLIWIRKDWMEQLELEEPKTLADLEEIAKAFIEQDPDGNGAKDTYGIAAKASFSASYGGDGNMCDIFLNVGGAAPGIWQEQEDGTVIYGSLMEGAKEALTLLNSWYEQGILPSDFATWDNDALNQAVGDNKAGIVFSPWWGAWAALNNNINLNETAEWSAYMLPEKEGDQIRSAGGQPVSNIYVVRKDFEDPSAFVYAYDMWCASSVDYVSEYEDYVEVNNAYNLMYGSVAPNACTLPMRTIQEKVLGSGEMSTEEDVKEYCLEVAGTSTFGAVEGAFRAKAVYDALGNGENPREVVTGDLDAITTYQQYLQWWVGPKALVDGNPTAVTTLFQGRTESMEMYSSFLSDLEKEAYVKMIMGDTDGKSISDYFDAFVASYLEQGGTAITAEVQEALGR